MIQQIQYPFNPPKNNNVIRLTFGIILIVVFVGGSFLYLNNSQNENNNKRIEQ